VSVWFEYGFEPTLASSNYRNTTTASSLPAGNSNVDVTESLSGLSSSTSYYYRIVASNGDITVKGAVMSGITIAGGYGCWAKAYGRFSSSVTYLDRADVVKATSDGGYLVAGSNFELPISSRNVGEWVVKVDTEGGLLWNRDFGSYIYSIGETVDGDYLAATGGGVIRLDKDGNEIWRKVYSFNYDTGATLSISDLQKSGSDFLLTGTTLSINSNSQYDIWVMKITDSGGVLWSRKYDAVMNETVASIRQVSDGIVVIGTTSSFGSGLTDIWILKLDNDGNVLWQKSYGGADNDVGINIEGLADGYIVAGESYSFTSDGSRDIWLLKLDTNGEIVWQQRYGTLGNDSPIKVVPTTTGFVLVTIWMDLIKLDSVGTMTAKRSYQGFYNTVYRSNTVDLDSSGNIIVAPTKYINLPSTWDRDFTIFRLDADGMCGSPGISDLDTATTGGVVTTTDATTTTITATSTPQAAVSAADYVRIEQLMP